LYVKQIGQRRLQALVIDSTGSWHGEACHVQGPQSWGHPRFEGLAAGNGDRSGMALSTLLKYQSLSAAIRAGSFEQVEQRLSCQTDPSRKNTRAGTTARHPRHIPRTVVK
jgi:hypothetical protein